MKNKFIYFLWATLIVSGCGLNRETRALRALQHCDFQLAGLEQVTLAGVDLSRLLDQEQELDLSRLPALAFAYLNQDLPLDATLQVQIHNPTKNLAGIGEFEYIILLDDLELVDGTSNLAISVPSESTITTPIRLRANIYKLLSNGNNLQRILQFLNTEHTSGRQLQDEALNLTFKIKPTLTLARQPIQYPGYITVQKSLDRQTILELLP